MCLEKKVVRVKRIQDRDQAVMFYLLGQLSFHVSWCWVNILCDRRQLPEAVQKIRVTQLSPSSLHIGQNIRDYPVLDMASSEEAIPFLGMMGLGKSSIIAKATDTDVLIGHGPESCTIRLLRSKKQR